jgi:Na+(H+)/acetate symporter ActP
MAKNIFINNIIYGWTLGATQTTAENTSNIWAYNDFYNNTTNRTNVTAGANDMAINPDFVDAANGNFAIGSALRAKGYPGVFPGGLTTGYLAPGAVQPKMKKNIIF